MNEDTVISVRGLGKLYELGATLSHDTLRDQITRSVKAFLSRLQGSNGCKDRKSSSTSASSASDRTFWALKNLSFDVSRGEVLGIIGRNGAGKSTLLKILSQITEPTEGEVRIRGRVGSLLEVGTGMHPELSGKENIYLNGAILGMSKAEINRKYDKIVEFSGISRFITTPIKRYSSGMRVRLGFAIAAHLDPDILIVDEVLAVGDAEFQKKCLGKMQDVADHKRTVIFVSHNMATIKRLCGRAILLDDGQLLQEGETAAIVNAYLRLNLVSGRRFVFAEQDHRYKSPFRIEAVDLCIPDKRNVFLYGEPISIDLSISCQEDIEGVRVGVGVVSEGIRLATVHSEPIDFLSNPSRKVLQCRFPGNVLKPGSFSLVLGAHQAKNGRALDHINYEVPLEISGIEARHAAAYDPKALGLFQISAQWAFEDSGKSPTDSLVSRHGAP